MAVVWPRHGEQLQDFEHAGHLMESEHSKAGRNGLACCGKLSRKCNQPSVVGPADQCSSVSGAGSVYAQWRPIPRMFHGGESRTAAALRPREPGDRKILWVRREAR